MVGKKGQKAWNKGIPLKDTISHDMNEIRKKNISATLKKKYASGERKNAMKGKKKSVESRMKTSESLRKAYQEGRRVANDEGKTPERKKVYHSLKYRLWRTAIFERDSYTCQVCNKVGGTLEAHHINRYSSFPVERFDLNNGLTVCKGDCHWEVERLSLDTQKRTKKIEINC